MTISQRVFSLMEKNNLSAREFSKRTGISYNTITDWKRKGTNPSADKIMDICYVLKVTPETILIGHGYDKALDDPLIFDKLQDPQERRLLESYRILSNKQRKLLWQYMEVLSQLTPKKTEPFDSDIDIES